jgi:hypothetical protein
VRHGINPISFFQLNVEYFNDEKKIYSKYEVEKNIPKKFRLYSGLIQKKTSSKDIEENVSYPIFIKPEWGQNSH